MINDAILILVLSNFVAIGLLPIVFFRRDGSFNLRWFATAAPFFVVPALLLLARFGLLESWSAIDIEIRWAAAALCSIGSIGVLAGTLHSHRVPLALWHQDNDAPQQLVTWGPYARIRHPFYTSFILAFAAAVALSPNLLTVAALVYSVTALTVTAIREERRLLKTDFGSEYRDYMATTGRFFPRIAG